MKGREVDITKPAIFDINNDYDFIYPEYEKCYGNCFWEDYETLDFYSFQLKMVALENNFKELCKARTILIENPKGIDKETKKWAKNYMTPEIKEYIQRRDHKNNLENLDSKFKYENVAVQQMVMNRLRERKGANVNNTNSND